MGGGLIIMKEGRGEEMEAGGEIVAAIGMENMELRRNMIILAITQLQIIDIIIALINTIQKINSPFMVNIIAIA